MYSCTRVKHPHSSKSKTHPRRQFPWQDLVQPNMKNLIQLFIMSDLSKIPSSFCTLFLTRLRKIMQTPLSTGYIFQIGVLPCTACRCTPGSSSCTPRQGAGGSRTRKKYCCLWLSWKFHRLFKCLSFQRSRNLCQLLLVLRHLLDHLRQVSHSLKINFCWCCFCCFCCLISIFLLACSVLQPTCAESFAPPSFGWIRFSLLNVCSKNRLA